MDSITSLDFSMLYFLQEHAKCAFFDTVMPVITALGNGGAVWIALALALIVSKRYRKQGVMMAAGLLLGLLIGNLILKNAVARMRPCWIDETVTLFIANPTDYSFPSGHTLASFVAAFTLVLQKNKLWYGAVPLAVLIAFSRLYLFVHFPSDVAASVLLAFLIACGVYVTEPLLRKKIGTKQQH